MCLDFISILIKVLGIYEKKIAKIIVLVVTVKLFEKKE